MTNWRFIESTWCWHYKEPHETWAKGIQSLIPWWVLFWWGCDSVSAISSELPWSLQGNHRQCQEWQRWQWKRQPGRSKPPWKQENNPKCPNHSSSSGNPPFLGHYYSGRSNAVWGQRTQAEQRRPELLNIDQYLHQKWYYQKAIDLFKIPSFYHHSFAPFLHLGIHWFILSFNIRTAWFHKENWLNPIQIKDYQGCTQQGMRKQSTWKFVISSKRNIQWKYFFFIKS